MNCVLPLLSNNRFSVLNLYELEIDKDISDISDTSKSIKLTSKQLPLSLDSDGHGNANPCGIAGTGVTGTGTGEKKITRDIPVPVLVGDGCVT